MKFISTNGQVLISVLTLVLVTAMVTGCSGGSDAPASTSAHLDDATKSEIEKAKIFLDAMQNLPPSVRQPAANAPKNAQMLRTAAAADPTIKQRMDSMGIQFK